MNEQPAPIFWDAAYWYVVPVTTDPRGNRRPATYPERFCAIYGDVDGVTYALVRTPDLWLTAPVVSVNVDDLIAGAQAAGFHPAGVSDKPRMRVRGA